MCVHKKGCIPNFTTLVNNMTIYYPKFVRAEWV